MGNCQAIDNATLLLQHPSGRVDKHYTPLSAARLMKLHPGHYVALLLTTTVYSNSNSNSNADAAHPLRVTRIKLLRPTDTLILGHVYRLLTSHEVMKGILAKKQAKLQQQHHKHGNMAEEKQSSSSTSDSTLPKKTNQERHRSRNSTPSKSRTWQPALKSISESAS